MIRIQRKRQRRHDPRYMLMGAMILVTAALGSFVGMYWVNKDNIDKARPFAVLETAEDRNQLAKKFGEYLEWELPALDVGALTYRRLDMDTDEIFALLVRADEDVNGLYFDVVMRRARELHNPELGIRNRLSWGAPPHAGSTIRRWPDNETQTDMYRRYWMARQGDVLSVDRPVRYRGVETPLLQSMYWLLGRMVKESNPRLEFTDSGNAQTFYTVNEIGYTLRFPYPDSFEYLSPLALGRGGGIHIDWALTAYESLEMPNLLMVEVGRETFPTRDIYQFDHLASDLRRYWLDKDKDFVWLYAQEFRQDNFMGWNDEHLVLIADDYEQLDNGVWIPRRRVLLEALPDEEWRVREEIVVLDAGVLESEREWAERIRDEAERAPGLYEERVLISPQEPAPVPTVIPPIVIHEQAPNAWYAETPPDYGLDALTFEPYEGETQEVLEALKRRDLELLDWSMQLTYAYQNLGVLLILPEGITPSYVQGDIEYSRRELVFRKVSETSSMVSWNEIVDDALETEESARPVGLPQTGIPAPFGGYQTETPTLTLLPDRSVELSPGWFRFQGIPVPINLPMRWGSEPVSSVAMWFGRGATLLPDHVARVLPARENPDIVLLEAYPSVQKNLNRWRFWLDRSKGFVWLKVDHDYQIPETYGYGSNFITRRTVEAYDYRQVDGQWIPFWVRMKTVPILGDEPMAPIRIMETRIEEVRFSTQEVIHSATPW